MIAFTDFPPHMRLMLLTVRSPLAPTEQADCQALIASGLDWNAFLAVAMDGVGEPGWRHLGMKAPPVAGQMDLLGEP